MTDLEIGLTVMSAVVAGVSLFGLFWLKIERKQAKEREQMSVAPKEQGKFAFPESRELAAMAGDR